MKKNTFFILLSLASAAALSFTSCTDMYDESGSTSTAMDNEIHITAMMGENVSTKTSSFGSDTLTTDNIKAFIMRAFSNSTTIIDTTKSNKIYTKGRFTYDSQEGWTDGNTLPYYWPEASVTFRAFSCSSYDGAQNSVNDTLPKGLDLASNKISWPDFQVEPSDSTYKTQRDYAAAVVSQSGRDGFTVGLKFQHLLSRLSINIWAPSVKFPNTQRLDVVSFGFNGVDVKGSFEYTGTATSDIFATSCWTSQTKGNVGMPAGTDTIKADKWNLTDSIPMTTSLQGTDKLSAKTPWLNVIPGSNVADTLTVFIKLKPKDTQKSEYYKAVSLIIPSGSVPEKSSGDGTDIYHPGYQYVYNLKVTGQDNDEGKVDSLKIELEGITVNAWSSSAKNVNTEHAKEVGANTLQAIFRDAEAFAQINLQKDVEMKCTSTDADTVVVSKSATLNLNGYNITVLDGATKPVFTIGNGVRLVIDNDTSSASEHGNAGGISNCSTSATLFNILPATSPAVAGTVIIRGGTFNFDPTSYIEGTTDDNDFPKTYKDSYFTDAYGNKKYRETKVTRSGESPNYSYSVVQTIKDYQAQ